MSRDIKLGLLVILVLLAVFGAVLFMRLRDQQKQTVVDKSKAGAKHDRQEKKNDSIENDAKAEKSRLRLSSGPAFSGFAQRESNARNDGARRHRDGDDRPDDLQNGANEGDGDEPMDDNAAQMAPDVGTVYGRDGLLDDSQPQDSLPALAPERDSSGMGEDPNDQPPASDEQSLADDPSARDEAAADADGLAADDAASADDRADESYSALEGGDRRAAGNRGDRSDDTDADRGYRRTVPADRSARDSFPRPGLQPADEDVRLEPSPASIESVDRRQVDDDRYQFTGGTYTVEANDNFWTISKKVYGTAAYFKALEEHNSEKYPDGNLLAVGDVVLVPDASILQQTYPKLCPKPGRPSEQRPAAQFTSQTRPPRGRTYQVIEGDTLFGIAKQELGRAARWKEIYDLNREQLGNDVNYLAPGTLLELPDDAGEPRDPITRRPRRGRYPR